MNSCEVETYYLDRDKPYNKFKDSFYLHAADFKRQEPTTWKGRHGKYIVTIIQVHRQHDITEEDVTIEIDPSFKEDEKIVFPVPSKKIIARTLNTHLDKIYG